MNRIGSHVWGGIQTGCRWGSQLVGDCDSLSKVTRIATLSIALAGKVSPLSTSWLAFAKDIKPFGSIYSIFGCFEDANWFVNLASSAHWQKIAAAICFLGMQILSITEYLESWGAMNRDALIAFFKNTKNLERFVTGLSIVAYGFGIWSEVRNLLAASHQLNANKFSLEQAQGEYQLNLNGEVSAIVVQRSVEQFFAGVDNDVIDDRRKETAAAMFRTNYQNRVKLIKLTIDNAKVDRQKAINSIAYNVMKIGLSVLGLFVETSLATAASPILIIFTIATALGIAKNLYSTNHASKAKEIKELKGIVDTMNEAIRLWFQPNLAAI